MPRSSSGAPTTPHSATEGWVSTVRPVRQFLVGALAAVADKRDTIAEPLLDDAVGQFDRGIEIFGILKLRPVEQQFRPLLGRRKISPRKIINVTRRAKLKNSTRHFHRPSFSG